PRGAGGVRAGPPGPARAAASAPAGSSARFPPPALPRPPAWTWAFTTTRPPMRWAMARASAAVPATSPRGTGTPNSRRIAFAWYSWIFMRGTGARWPASAGRLLAAQLPEHPHHRVVVVVDHALLERDDRVVGDLDV